MLEEAGGRGTFYIAGGLINQPNNHCEGIDADGRPRGPAGRDWVRPEAATPGKLTLSKPRASG